MSYTDDVSAQTANLMACNSCRKVAYCSVECRTEDWKARHKHECGKELEAKDDETAGEVEVESKGGKDEGREVERTDNDEDGDEDGGGESGKGVGAASKAKKNRKTEKKKRQKRKKKKEEKKERKKNDF